MAKFSLSHINKLYKDAARDSYALKKQVELMENDNQSKKVYTRPAKSQGINFKQYLPDFVDPINITRYTAVYKDVNEFLNDPRTQELINCKNKDGTAFFVKFTEKLDEDDKINQRWVISYITDKGESWVFGFSDKPFGFDK